MASFTVLYDACVLYPAPLRDLLISLAVAGLFRARWSNRIHEEWIRSLLRERPDLKPEALHRTRQLMDRAVPDCLVSGFEDVISSLELPDENDCHVLAAAICGRADVIITLNLKDFPSEVLETYGIEAQHPDEFIAYLLDLSPGVVCTTIHNMRKRLKNPPRTAIELLQTLESLELVETVAKLRQFEDLL